MRNHIDKSISCGTTHRTRMKPDIPKDCRKKYAALVYLLEKNGWFTGNYDDVYFIDKYVNISDYGQTSDLVPVDLLDCCLIYDENFRESKIIDIICRRFIAKELFYLDAENEERRFSFLLGLENKTIHIRGFSDKFQEKLAAAMRCKLNKIKSKNTKNTQEKSSLSNKIFTVFNQPNSLRANTQSKFHEANNAINEEFEEFKRLYHQDYNRSLFHNPFSAMKRKLSRLYNIEDVINFSKNHPDSKRTKHVLRTMNLL